LSRATVSQGTAGTKEKRKNQSRLKAGFFVPDFLIERKIKAGFPKQAFFVSDFLIERKNQSRLKAGFFEEKEKEKGGLGARPRRAAADQPPPTHPLEKERERKKPDACFC
jgi:hypothetical protein